MKKVALAVLALILLGLSLPALALESLDLYPILDPQLVSEMPDHYGTVLGRHRVELAWAPHEDPACAFYRVDYHMTGPLADDRRLSLDLPGGASSALVEELNLGSPYLFRVTALDGAGQALARSGWEPAGTRGNGFPWFDDLEGGLDCWDLVASDWDTTSTWASSPDHSFTDSPDANYGNLAASNLVTSVNLMTAQMPVLEFMHYYNIQTDGDFGYLEVSEDEGANWERLLSVNGSGGGWLEEKIDLSPYRGNVNLKIRWQLSSNASGISDGWYLDDVKIRETIYDPLALPILDDANEALASDSLWFTADWRRVPGGVGGGHYYTDSPYGEFAEYLSTKMTLVENLDLAGASNPWLVFRQRLDLDFQNSARVEVSIDGGANWSLLQEWEGPVTISEWARVPIDLSEYAGGEIRLRFHLLNLGVDAGQGWDLDEIHLADLPETLDLTLAGNYYDSVDLSWTAFAGAGFGAYEVRRDTSPDFLLGGDWVGDIPEIGTTALSDFVDPSTTCYYQVFVRHEDGHYLAQSDIVTRTPFELPVMAYPFFDDMESGEANFLPIPSWAITEEAAVSGTHSWSDSPGSNYADNETATLSFQVDLGAGSALRPMLSFQHLHGFQQGSDWGFVDVSTDGGTSFTPIYYISGSSGDWQQARVDLTAYRSQMLTLRFRMATDASGQNDGWHIDDIRVDENGMATPPFEFVDAFDDSLQTLGWWVPGAFQRIEPSGDGSHYWSNRANGLANFYPGATHLFLGQPLDLSGAIEPRIFLRYRSYYSAYNSARNYLQASTDGGNTWATLYTFPYTESWAELQYDFGAFAGAEDVLLRIRSYDGDSGGTNPWFDLDDFSVTEAPDDVTLSLPDDQDYQCTLEWTENTQGDFASYVIKRSAATPVTLSASTIATIDAAATTSYVDEGLSPYDVYYYRVFIYDDLGLVSDGSNEVLREAKEPPLLAYPFFDDMESGGGNFLAEPPWALSDEMPHSGSYSWSDSPGESYGNGLGLSFVMRLDLSGGAAVRPELSFWQHYGLQTNYDWGYVDISTDEGLSYQTISFVSGSSGEWRRERVDLTPFRGNIVDLRFRLATDGGTVADGWHIDDIRVDECSTPALAFPFVDTFDDSTQTLADWMSGGFAWAQPSGDGSHYMSNRATGETPDFNPGATLLTPGGSFDLSGASEPQLRFLYRAYYSSYNSARSYCEVSGNGGETWSNLATLNSLNDWAALQLDLEGFAGQEDVLIRFRSYDGYGGGGNPWLDVEDFTLSEQPEDVVLTLVDNQAYSAELEWSYYQDGGFDSYVIKRSSSSPVTLSSPTVATITAASDTTYVEEGLSPYDIYYYKVFVYDGLGLSSDGSNEVLRGSLDPPLLAYPFFDDMEAGGGNFLAETPWTLSAEAAFSGDYAWSDSPGENYGNDLSTSLVMRVDLSGGAAMRPELSYRQQFGFETNNDWGVVEASTDGGSSFHGISYVTGASGGWEQERIDLLPYRGQVLYLRFRVSTGSSGQADGWHIDDVRVDECSTPALSYPFADSFDDSTSAHGNWMSGGFGWTSPSDDGTPYWSNKPTGSCPNFHPGSTFLSLGNELDLSAAVNPQIRMRYRSYDSSYDSANSYLQVSQDGGLTWDTVHLFGYVDSWTPAQFDMTAYAGPEPLLLRIRCWDGDSGGTNPWFEMDGFSFSDQPADVTLSLVDNQAYSAELRWAPSELANFASYELRRSATSPVSLSSPLVASFSAAEDTVFVDTGLQPNETWYYKVYVYDDLGLYSQGSNETVRIPTELNLLAYPFFDDMESGGGNFMPELPWAVTEEVAYSGTSSWSDSPYGNYENSGNASLAFQVDLAGGGAVRPELSFWHQYGFETNSDWGFVDVSTDGGATYEIAYYLTGSGGSWEMSRLDLTPWRGQVLTLRFRVSTGSSGQADGWHIDDIRVDENPAPALPYPFVDTFDEKSFTEAAWAYGTFARTSPSEDGSWYCSNYPTGDLPNFENDEVLMALSSGLDLSAAQHPELRVRYRAYNSNYNATETYLQASTDNGTTWGTLVQFSAASSWTSSFVDMSGYVGPAPVLLRVRSRDRSGNGTEPWCDLENLAIVENPDEVNQADWCQLIQPERVWLTAGQTSSQIFANVYEPGVTDAAGQGAGLLAQIGSGPDGTHPRDPAAGWIWSTAAYAGDAASDSMDVYAGSLVGGAIGSYDYGFRFSLDAGVTWVYADLNGCDMGSKGFNYFKSANAGDLVVTLEPDMVISETSIELTLPVGQATSRAITLGNDGEGPLIFVAEESEAPPAPLNVAWLSLAPVTATVEPQEYQELIVSVDATELSAGQDYGAWAMLYTNDPDYSRMDIPVTVHVVPPSAAHLSGTVLDVDHQATEEIAFVEVYDGGSLVAQAAAGADGYYNIFGIAEGTYTVRAHSEGYYPGTLEVEIPTTGVNFTLHRVPWFTPTNTNVNFFGESCMLDGLPLSVGDVVTVQDAQDIVCGSYHVQVPGHYGFLHAYGDDPTTPDVDEGAEPGDTLSFRINGELANSSGPDDPIWTSGGDVRQVELSAVSSLVDLLQLDAGWNLVSFTRLPENDSLPVILAELIDDENLLLVSSFDQVWGGALTYDPDHPEFSDLWFMDPEHGYWIKIAVADELSVGGAIHWPDNPIALEQGWNLTAYLPEDTREVARALESVDGLYELVSGFDEGAQTYVPGEEPYNTLTELRNGFGYWIKMLSADELRYDFLPEGLRGAPAWESWEPEPQRDFVATPWWDSYFGTITINGEPLAEGESLEVRDPQDVVCGQFTVSTEGHYGFLAAYGDDPATGEDEGAVTGDQVTFHYEGRLLATAPAEMTWRGDQSLFQLDIVATLTGVEDDLPAKTCLRAAYPNPFNPATTIRYELASPGFVGLKVYDARGRLVRTLVSGQEDAGVREVTWRGRDDEGRAMPSGIYFYRLETEGFTQERKMLLLK